MSRAKNCVVVRYVRDARNDLQPAFWSGRLNEWVLEYPDAALMDSRNAIKHARVRDAEAYADWGLDSERCIHRTEAKP